MNKILLEDRIANSLIAQGWSKSDAIAYGIAMCKIFYPFIGQKYREISEIKNELSDISIVFQDIVNDINNEAAMFAEVEAILKGKLT